MNFKRGILWLKRFLVPFDWKLLVFLLLFLNVKLIFKLAAILLIYILQPRTGFGLKFKSSRLPLFYPSMIIIAVLNQVIHHDFANTNYWIVLWVGIGFWILSLLAIHHLKIFVDNNSEEKIYRTLIIFFF